MYFDRFDICQAYYMYATLYHEGQWSTTYQIFGRLHRMKFNPGMGLNSEVDLEENARAIFDSLVERKGMNIRDLEENNES